MEQVDDASASASEPVPVIPRRHREADATSVGKLIQVAYQWQSGLAPQGGFAQRIPQSGRNSAMTLRP